MAYMLIVRVALLFSYSIDLDGTEYVFVHYVQRLLENKPIYGNPTAFPYLACLFTPLYIYTLKGLVCLFNPSPQQALHTTYIIGRAFSLLLVITQVGLLAVYMRKRFRLRWQPLLICGCLYLALVTGHLFVIRPEAMKSLLFTISFLALTEYAFFNPRIVCAATFLTAAVLSVYTKQDMLVWQTIMLLTLWLVKKEAKYAVLLILFWGTVVGVLLFLQQLFGAYFFTNVVLFNFQEVEDALRSVNVLFILFSVCRIAPLLILTAYYRNRNGVPEEHKALLNYTFLLSIVLFIVAHLFMFRAGSYINYAFDAILVIIFSLAASMQQAIKQAEFWIKIRAYIISAYVLFLIAGNILIHNYVYRIDEEKARKELYESNMQYARQVKALVQDEVIFIPDISVAVFYQHLHLLYGYDYHIGRFMEIYLPFSVNSHLSFFNSAEYDAHFEDGTVNYILCETRKDKHVRYYYPNYVPYKTIGKVTVYRFQKQHSQP